MGNFKSSAFQVCHFWSMRSGLLLAEKHSQIPADDVQYSSELDFNIAEQRISPSTLDVCSALAIVQGDRTSRDALLLRSWFSMPFFGVGTPPLL